MSLELPKDRPWLFAAPMSGYSDTVFRKFTRNFGADLTFTEMISAEGIIYATNKTTKYLEFNESEKPLSVQLFTADPRAMKEAAKIVASMGFDFLDVNMGCPVRKVIKKGAGSKLLSNPQRSIAIVDAALMSGLPVSVKLRTGFEYADYEAIITLLEKFRSLGVKFVTIHGRTAKQLFSHKADWSFITDVAKNVDIPVVAIARGAIANFELFSQTNDFLSNKEYREINLSERIDTFLSFLMEEIELRGEKKGIIYCRKQIMKLLKCVPDSSKLRAYICQIESYSNIRKILKNLKKKLA
jgi:tRNA-dihydrouridine synthase B